MANGTRLEFREGSSSKFWEGSASGRSLVIRFGRIGTDGQEQVKQLPDAKAAASALAKAIAEKVKKGYAPAAGVAPPGAAPAKAAPAPPGAASKKAATAPAKAGRDGKLVDVLQGLTEVAAAAPRPSAAAALAKLDQAGAAHPDLRALYGFAGNLRAVLGDADGLEWLDLSQALDTSRELHAGGDAPGLFAIAGDRGGNYACFEPASGKVKDWDHETSEATPLAPSLAAFLEKRALTALRRMKKEQAAIDAQKGKATTSGGFPATPKKIAKEPNALVAKLDSKGYSGGLSSMVFLDEGRVACGMQNSAKIVSLKDQTSTDVDAPGRGLAYDPIGRRVILVSSGTVCFASIESGKLLATFECEGGDVVAVSPDGSLACIVGSSGHVSLWDLQGGKGIPKAVKEDVFSTLPKGKPLASLAGHDGNVTSVRFSPDGATLVTGDYEGRLCVWDVAKRARKAKVELGGSILGVDYATDGESLFVAVNSTGTIEVLDGAGKRLRRWKCNEAYDVRTLSPGAIATFSMVELAIVDPRNGKAFCRIPRGKGSRWPRIGGVRGDLLLTTSPAGIFRVK